RCRSMNVGYGQMNLSQEAKLQTDPSLSPSPEVNGSPHPGSYPPGDANGRARALPSDQRRRRGWLFYIAIFGGLLLLAGGITTFVYLRAPAARPDVLTHTVKRESLDVTVS